MADVKNTATGLTRADLMTAADVAILLGVPISTVRHWGRVGVLPRVKLGRHVRFIRAHVERTVLDAEQHALHRFAIPGVDTAATK
jgi:excisionase family DNA binding protein